MRTADVMSVTTLPALRAVTTRIEGALLLSLRPWHDERGFFQETFVRSKYAEAGITDDFVQDSMSFSTKGILRGLHADPRMSKLVHVLRGEVFDVIVDARCDSPTFRQWQGFTLSAENHAQLYIPAGCLHGFLALSAEVIFCYKQSAQYAPGREIGVLWNDPEIGIEWPAGVQPIVSSKDKDNITFASAFSGGLKHFDGR